MFDYQKVIIDVRCPTVYMNINIYIYILYIYIYSMYVNGILVYIYIYLLIYIYIYLPGFDISPSPLLYVTSQRFCVVSQRHSAIDPRLSSTSTDPNWLEPQLRALLGHAILLGGHHYYVNRCTYVCIYTYMCIT